MGALTMLNSLGDSTIMWTEDHDPFWEAAIQAMMDRGVVFFLIDPRNLRRQLKKASDAKSTRHVAIMDSPGAEIGVRLLQVPGSAEASKLIEDGKGEVTRTPDGPVKTRRRAKTAKEAASGDTVAVQPRSGG